MIRILFGLLILILPVQAGNLTLLGAGKPPAAAVSYTGPGDIVASATAWYGVRAYNAATRGATVMDVCNTTGGVEVACATFSSDATTGDLVVGTIGGLTCSGLGVACTIKKLYDQTTGNNCTGATCDLTQATIAVRPQLVPSCINGKPCIRCSIFNISSANNLSSISQPYTVSHVSSRTASFTTAQLVLYLGSGAVQYFYAGSANTFDIFAGATLAATAADSAFHAYQSIFNNTSSDNYVDGGSTTGAASTAAAAGAIQVCATSAGAVPFKGDLTEIGIWSGAFTGTDQTNVNSNQHTYYGF